jgi:hypothetical protein
MLRPKRIVEGRIVQVRRAPSPQHGDVYVLLGRVGAANAMKNAIGF